MTNPIVIFWKWINPVSKKKSRNYNNLKQWAEKNTANLIKLALTLAVLIPVLVYYVKCYEVPVYTTEMKITRINNNVGHTYSYSSIHIVHDYNRSKGITGVPEEGVYVHCNMSKKYDKKQPLPYLSEEQLASNKHDGLIQVMNKLKKEHDKSELQWDSVRYAYKLTISTSVFRPFTPYLTMLFQQDIYSEKKETGWGELEGLNHAQASYLSSTIYENNAIVSDYWLFSDKMRPKHIGSIGFGIDRKGTFGFQKHFWQNVIDVSRAVEVFKFKPFDLYSEGIENLKFTYCGPTEFSAMKPTPDIVTVNSIEFTDSMKLVQIAHNGLTFHTKFPDMENKQQARTFALTTILTLLITILLKIVYDLTLDLWSWLKLHHKRILYAIFILAVLIPIIFLILCMGWIDISFNR